jgi:hypothetical protein
MLTFTDVEVPAANVPLVGEAVTQEALGVTVQPIDDKPVFETESEAATGENGPPIGPELLKPLGDTAKAGAPVIVNVTAREAFPSPLVLLLKMIVSVRLVTGNEFAPELTETVMVALAPGANVPEVGDSVSHVSVLAAVQLRLKLPELVNV